MCGRTARSSATAAAGSEANVAGATCTRPPAASAPSISTTEMSKPSVDPARDVTPGPWPSMSTAAPSTASSPRRGTVTPFGVPVVPEVKTR